MAANEIRTHARTNQKHTQKSRSRQRVYFAVVNYILANFLARILVIFLQSAADTAVT